MAAAKHFSLREFDSMPDSAKARVKTVAALYAVSVPTVWRWVKLGHIPAPQKIGGAAVWSVGELRRHLSESPPVQMASPAAAKVLDIDECETDEDASELIFEQMSRLIPVFQHQPPCAIAYAAIEILLNMDAAEPGAPSTWTKFLEEALRERIVAKESGGLVRIE